MHWYSIAFKWIIIELWFEFSSIIWIWILFIKKPSYINLRLFLLLCNSSILLVRLFLKSISVILFIRIFSRVISLITVIVFFVFFWRRGLSVLIHLSFKQLQWISSLLYFLSTWRSTISIIITRIMIIRVSGRLLSSFVLILPVLVFIWVLIILLAVIWICRGQFIGYIWSILI